MKLIIYSLFCVILFVSVSGVKSQNSTLNTSTTTSTTTAIPTTTKISTTTTVSTKTVPSTSKSSVNKGCILSQGSKYETTLFEKLKPLFGDKYA